MQAARCRTCGRYAVLPTPIEQSVPDFEYDCPECTKHVYECDGCGQEYDDRITGEPRVGPVSSWDGLPSYVLCPTCAAERGGEEDGS